MITRAHEKTSGVIDTFIILIAVMVSGVYTYIKTHQMIHLSMHSLFYINYTLMKLLKEREKVQDSECAGDPILLENTNMQDALNNKEWM